MADGDIGAVIDSLEFDPVDASRISICHVAGDVYAIAYKGENTYGHICTFSCDAAGNISNTTIDNYQFTTSLVDYVAIIKGPATEYIIAYSASTLHGWLITVTINNDGTITHSIDDSLEFDSTLAYPGNILEVVAGMYALVYCGPGADGWVKSFACTAAGVLSEPANNNLEFDPVVAQNPWFCHVSGTIYAVAYRGTADDGYVKTFSITASGVITAGPASTLEFDTVQCHDPTICKAVDNYFAIAYWYTSANAALVIVEIDPSGNITDPIKDSYLYDLGGSDWPFVLAIGLGYLAIAYTASNDPGRLKTFLCDGSGQLNSNTIDTLVYDGVKGADDSIIHVSGDIYLIAYIGPDLDGWVCSVDIKTPSAEFPHHEMIMGMGP